MWVGILGLIRQEKCGSCGVREGFSEFFKLLGLCNFEIGGSLDR